MENNSRALMEFKAAHKIWKRSILTDKGIKIHKGQDMLGVWYKMSDALCKADLELLGAIWWIT